jgi:hypothetical protein
MKTTYLVIFYLLYAGLAINATEPDKLKNSQRKSDISKTDFFPQIQLKNVHFYLPDSIGDMTCESCVQTPGCPFNYHIVNAMYPENSTDWRITKLSARKNRKQKTHPLYPIAKIYKAFKKGKTSKIIRQYNKDSRSAMKEVFKERKKSCQEMKDVFGPIDYLSIPILVEFNSGYFIITANKENRFVYPFYAEKIKKRRMRLSTAIDSTGLFADIILLGINYDIPKMVLDDDYDQDAVLNLNDNCPCNHNFEQKDNDGDHVGNTCDNCVDVANTNQEDYDGDGIGDVCDNCPKHKNSDQIDTDGDGIGDRCEEMNIY